MQYLFIYKLVYSLKLKACSNGYFRNNSFPCYWFDINLGMYIALNRFCFIVDTDKYCRVLSDDASQYLKFIFFIFFVCGGVMVVVSPANGLRASLI